MLFYMCKFMNIVAYFTIMNYNMNKTILNVSSV